MHTGVRAPPSRNPDLSVHNRRITYLLGPYPGGPRHDGIDYANSRNRPSWPKPFRIMLPLLQIRSLYPRLFPSSPLPSFLSLPLSVHSFDPSLFPPSSLSHSSFIRTPYSFRPSLNLYTLSCPSSSHQGLLSFYRVVDPPSSAPFLFFPRPYS